VDIIELLISKNVDKIHKEQVTLVLSIFALQDPSPLLRFKLLKTLAHLQNLEEESHKEKLPSVLEFLTSP